MRKFPNYSILLFPWAHHYSLVHSSKISGKTIDCIEKVYLSNIVQETKLFNSLIKHFLVRLLDFGMNMKNVNFWTLNDSHLGKWRPYLVVRSLTWISFPKHKT